MIALGSNLGNRHAHLGDAIGRLTDAFGPLTISSPHETEPVDVPLPQSPFLNMAVVGSTTRSPAATLTLLLEVERELGRERPFPGAPRTIDLDLILYGDAVLSQPGLEVPHPRFRERLFVLEPLVEIAPTFRDPVSGLTVAALLERLRRKRQNG